MEYFPKIEIKHHEKSKDFNYQDWYSQISEDFKLGINDLEIENDSRFNYDTWFKKLNSKDKIKAEYSKILKNIEITERITQYVENNFFKKEFDGDLEKLEQNLNETIFGDKTEDNKKQNKKELSKNQVHYFKQIIKKTIEKIKNINIFFQEVKNLENNNNRIDKILKGKSGIKKITENFKINFNGYCFIIHLSENDMKINFDHGQAQCNESGEGFNYIILSNDYVGREEEILVHELRHLMFSVHSNNEIVIDDIFEKTNKVETEIDLDNIYKDVEKITFETAHNEVVAYMSGSDIEEFKYDNNIWGYRIRQIINESHKFLEKKENKIYIDFINKKNKETVLCISDICKKYFFLVEKLFFKYQTENKSMHEFEAIVRNISPQKYKRLCIFLSIDPEKFEEIYDKNWTRADK